MEMYFKVLSTLLVITWCTQPSVAMDPVQSLPEKLCAFKRAQIYSAADVMACFRSVAYNATTVKRTLDTLSVSMQLYAFRDIAANPGNMPYFEKVDLLGELEKMRTEKFENDLAFQLKLGALFYRLRDAHTDYNAPQTYQNMYWLQPFSTVSVYNKMANKLELRIAPFVVSKAMGKYYQQTYGLNISQFYNQEIVEINNEPAVEYLASWANAHVGLSKDPQIRFNLANTGFVPHPNHTTVRVAMWQERSSFGWQQMPFWDVPAVGEVPRVVYTVKDQMGTMRNLSVPWVAEAGFTYANTSEWYYRYYHYYTPPPHKKHNKSKTADVPRNPLRSFNLNNYRRMRTIEPSAEMKLGDMTNTDNKGSPTKKTPPYRMLFDLAHSQLYLLNDSVTAVWHFDDMEPNEKNMTKAVNLTYHLLAKHGVKRIILDLTENGGGDICVGRYLLDSLFVTPDFGPSDMPNNEVSRHLAMRSMPTGINNISYWSGAIYTDAISGKNYTYKNLNWLNPGLQRIRNGKPGNFSQLIDIVASNIGCGNLPQKPLWTAANPPPFKPSQFLIVTHGLCGSTCALFANHMKRYSNVGAVVVGGLLPQHMPRSSPVMQYTSFPGIQVLDSPYLDMLYNKVRDGPADPLVPHPLPVSGEYRFCCREIYPRPPVYKHTLPLEFTWQPADWHVQAESVEEAFRTERMWYKFKNYFEDAWSEEPRKQVAATLH